MKIIPPEQQIVNRKTEVWELRSHVSILKEEWTTMKRKNESGLFRSRRKFFEAKWKESVMKQAEEALTEYYYSLDEMLNNQQTAQECDATTAQ
jgi:hypothetical protein